MDGVRDEDATTYGSGPSSAPVTRAVSVIHVQAFNYA